VNEQSQCTYVKDVLGLISDAAFRSQSIGNSMLSKSLRFSIPPEVCAIKRY